MFAICHRIPFGLLMLLGVVVNAVSGFNARAQAYFTEGRLVIPLQAPEDGSSQNTHRGLPGNLTVRTLPDGIAFNKLPPSVIEEFGAYLLELAADHALPGIAMAIVQEADYVWEGFGGVRTGGTAEPVDRTTLFNLGPATQALTSLLAAVLAADQELLFEKPARRIHNEFRMSDTSAGERVQLMHLLNMTAGLPSYTDSILNPNWARPEDVFTLIAQSPVVAQPGRVHSRSMVSAAAGGYLLGQLAMPREAFYTAYVQTMHTRLLDPLDMKDTGFSHQAALATGAYASPHERDGDRRFKVARRWESDPNALAPALGAKTSLRDVVRWLQFELSAGRLPDGGQLTSADAVRARWQPAVAEQSQNYGMGWTRRQFKGLDFLVALGSYDRHSAMIGLFPAYRTGFAVLVNTDAAASTRIFEEMSLGLAEMLAELQLSSATDPTE